MGERTISEGATAHVCGQCPNSGTRTPLDGLGVEQGTMGVDFAQIVAGEAAGALSENSGNEFRHRKGTTSGRPRVTALFSLPDFGYCVRNSEAVLHAGGPFLVGR